MKTTALLVCLSLLVSCGLGDSKNKTATQSQNENTVLVIITDNSKSFVRRCPKITGALLKPVSDKISTQSNLDIRVGRVIANSDTEFLRYYKKKSNNKENNPWLATDKTETVTKDNWQDFSNTLQQLYSAKPVTGSDIGGALSHALLIFQEYPANTRKILCIATDYKNNGLSIPAIAPDIEVISIGTLPGVAVEKILHTQNVKRFETIQTAIEYLLSTF